jgi:hypothetical protein
MGATRIRPRQTTPEERASWAAEASSEWRAELSSDPVLRVCKVSDYDCVAYSAADADGYEVGYHVAAPVVSPAPRRSVAQALAALAARGLVQVSRFAVDSTLEVQLRNGSETLYLARPRAEVAP